MKRLLATFASLLLAGTLLAACGSSSPPNGPPPLVGAPTASATPARPTAGTMLQFFRLTNLDSLAWSPDGKRLAADSTNTRGALIQVLDAETGAQTLSVSSPYAATRGLAWSADGARLLVASNTFAGDPYGLHVWDAFTGKDLFAHFPETDATLNSADAVAWSPDGARLAIVYETSPIPTLTTPNPPIKRVLVILDAATGKTLHSLDPFPFEAKSIVWSPDGTRLIVLGESSAVQLWDANTLKPLLTYQGHTSAVFSVAWSPDGKDVASGSGDTTIQVWDAASGTLNYTYHGHSGEVHAVAWSPKGARIASGSFASGGGTDENPMQVWDAFSGQHLLSYHGHSFGVFLAAWSPDGTRIASSDGQTLQVWLAA